MSPGGAGRPALPALRLGARALDGLLARLDTVRLRLAALVLLAAVPLLVLSGTILWQDYDAGLDRSLQEAVQRREAAVARHLAALDGMEQMLRTLARVRSLARDDEAACARRLGELMGLDATRYAGLAVFDAPGVPRCVVPPVAATPHALSMERALFARAEASPDGLALGAVRPASAGEEAVLPAVLFAGPAGAKVFLRAELRLGWFVGEASRTAPGLAGVWLADSGGGIAPVAELGAATLPDPATLARLLAGGGVSFARSRGGPVFAYASALLPGGFRLLVAYPVDADAARARAQLLRRLGELVLLLVLGLAGLGIGTHVALARPLDQLSRAVRRWGAGGVFEARAVRTPPREIAALADSFAQATASLAEQAENLREAKLQQELLMKEIHHRVKNNLQIVASLLNLQASRIRLPAARAEFASARDRVRALATLHRHLYSQGDLTTISMRPFLEELVAQLFEAMGEREGNRIAVSIEASPMELSSDQGVPLALIVTEAVSNALKYAFPAGRRGHVRVRLSEADGQAVLAIDDDGVGMPAGPVETETGTRDGLGMQLIRGFAKQLHATLEVGHAEGTAYRLSFALERG